MVDEMKRKMKSVTLFFLIFLLFEALSSQACWKEERQALFALKSRFDYSIFSNVDTDCCEWGGVYCYSSTGRVPQLYLSDSVQQYIDYSDFSILAPFHSQTKIHSSHLVSGVRSCLGTVCIFLLFVFSFYSSFSLLLLVPFCWVLLLAFCSVYFGFVTFVLRWCHFRLALVPFGSSRLVGSIFTLDFHLLYCDYGFIFWVW